VVVGFHGGVADLAYFWSGDGGVRYRLGTESRTPVIRARESYWTPSDAHCCPIRSYAFTVGRHNDGSVAELSDERPWLGAVVRPVDVNDNASPLQIVDVVTGSPAVGKIEKGDVLSAVGNARRRGAQYAIGPVLYDQFAKLSAGDTVRLHLLRHGAPVAVTLTLGSLNDASVGAAYVPTNDLVAAL